MVKIDFKGSSSGLSSTIGESESGQAFGGFRAPVKTLAIACLTARYSGVGYRKLTNSKMINHKLSNLVSDALTGLAGMVEGDSTIREERDFIYNGKYYKLDKNDFKHNLDVDLDEASNELIENEFRLVKSHKKIAKYLSSNSMAAIARQAEALKVNMAELYEARANGIDNEVCVIIQKEGIGQLSKLTLITDKLGSGGFSQAFKGLDLINKGREIAIKCPLPQFCLPKLLCSKEYNQLPSLLRQMDLLSSFDEVEREALIAEVLALRGIQEAWDGADFTERRSLTSLIFWLIEAKNEDRLLQVLVDEGGVVPPSLAVGIGSRKDLGFTAYVETCLQAGDASSEGLYKDLLLSERLGVLAPLVKTLRSMHQKEIHHGDIKPENILVSKDVKGIRFLLADFGGARRSAIATTSTCYYCPPQNDKLQWKYNDTYSMALSCLEILKGLSLRLYSDPRDNMQPLCDELRLLSKSKKETECLDAIEAFFSGSSPPLEACERFTAAFESLAD